LTTNLQCKHLLSYTVIQSFMLTCTEIKCHVRF
jgi:hypothetical protein